MGILLAILLWLIVLFLTVPIITLTLECFIASLFIQNEQVQNLEKSPSLGILIPAHNEGTVISQTLKSIISQVENPQQIVVIADNCNDDTAAIAQNYNVTVLEREDTERRGKGYALDYGLQWLKPQSPEVVVIVDADCLVEANAIQSISQLAKTQNRPVQATYLMETPSNPTPKDTISALAFLVKNLVRPIGLQKLGLPIILQGTGMAFPWSALEKISLASGNIVEDMQLGIDLTIAGYPPMFCSEAKVTGCLPKGNQVAKTQRTRWEHGHLQTLLTQVPYLIKNAIKEKRYDLLAMAMDLSVTPLSFLVMMWLAATSLAIVTTIMGGQWLPAVILLLQGGLLFIDILISWKKFASQAIPLQTLLSVPLYIIWKLPIYFGFATQRQKEWISTKRDPVDDL